jgi:hypothetical protein
VHVAERIGAAAGRRWGGAGCDVDDPNYGQHKQEEMSDGSFRLCYRGLLWPSGDISLSPTLWPYLESALL